HKLLVLSHSPSHYRQMGKLVAHGKTLPVQELYAQYEKLLMAALKLKTTLRKNVNVLHHVMGYFKKDLSKDEKQELLEVIEHYREGLVPLIVPITLMNHYVRKYQQPYLQYQTYLNPHPIALRLRTHV
ncbi:MAG: YbgA family protein, partial [Deltaproteobacteria bacterium]